MSTNKEWGEVGVGVGESEIRSSNSKKMEKERNGWLDERREHTLMHTREGREREKGSKGRQMGYTQIVHSDKQWRESGGGREGGIHEKRRGREKEQEGRKGSTHKQEMEKCGGID